MSDVVSVSVIIPAYGASPHLQDALSAIEAGTRKPDQIIVSHSGSDDPTEILRETHPSVCVLHSDERLFAGAARNRGANLAPAGILAFCDSDVLPRPDWLERLVSALVAMPDCFVVGSVGVARSGGYWGMSNWLCEFSEQAPWRCSGFQTGGASCNMAVRKMDFDAVGGFPQDAMVGEDTLLFFRLRHGGARQWFEVTAEGGHYNNNGIKNFVRHQFMHGKYFLKSRRQTKLPGWLVVRSGAVVPLLPSIKMGRVIKRMLQGGVREWVRVLFYFPGISVGMIAWGGGLILEVLADTSHHINQGVS